MRRTWFRKTSDRTFLRNCPLIEMDMRRYAGRPFAAKKLAKEWDICFRQGVFVQKEISRRDRWIEYDDSPEANQQWLEEFLKSGGKKT